MVMSGFAYEKEEASDALTEELIAEGFTQNEDDSNLWAYADYEFSETDDSYINIYAVYNVETNYGVVHVYGEWIEESVTYHDAVFIARWNYDTNDWDAVSETYM